MKPLAILNKYFNTNNDPEGYVRVKASEFAAECRALSDDEKAELVQLAAEDMGIEVTNK